MIALLLLSLALDVIRENPNQASGLREPDQAINDGCSLKGAKLACPIQAGTHVYTVPSSSHYVELKNGDWMGRAFTVTRVQTAMILGTWGEISVYEGPPPEHGFFGCDVPWPGYCGWQPPGIVTCPCQKDLDPGPGLLLAGPVGNMSESPTRTFPDLIWGADGFTVKAGHGIVLHDNFHSSPATTYAVTVEAREGGLTPIRQPILDQVLECTGVEQHLEWEPRQMAENVTITGAQIYAVGGVAAYGNDPIRMTNACFYILDANPTDPKVPGALLWAMCGDKARTTAYVDFATEGEWRDWNRPSLPAVKGARDVKAGQWVVWHAINKCKVPSAWDGVASITLRRTK